ncbi:MAG: T9SS type A sorting domain-containing protein [Ignavibacterium sp.]|nr:T9SS type A sorting domain-containing protein [Ignavibacterium sp.]
MFIPDRIKIILLLIISLLISFSTIHSQQFQRNINQPEVTGFKGVYNSPFSGGFNNIEHQFFDIDNDGDYDFFFLNSDGTFGWFENTGSKFNPEFNLSVDTIPGLFFSDWFYFVDIDNDGDFDLFTGNSENIRFLRNAGNVNVPLFAIEQDTLKDDNGLPIFSEFGSNPVYVDVDGDGDYDFLSGNSAGTVTFYENVGSTNHFNFRFITNFWQDILIIGGLDDPRHGSSSFDFIDLDSDGDHDLIWGDFFSRSLYLIENQGTPFEPSMKLISNVYPINEDSIYTSGYNMPRFVDIDGDGDPDLFVSVLYDPTVTQSLMYYENIGTSQLPNHVKITEDYIYSLDLGNNSHPVFIDIDSDGDPDMFIGSLNNPIGTLHYFENEGSALNPVFVYKDTMFAGIEYPLSVLPAFGDLDGDGDYDLLIGKFDGKISVYRNDGNIFNPQFIYAGELMDANQNVIDIGTSSVPFLVDIENDGDLDLVIGAFNGRFSLYKNIGDAFNYSFELVQNYFSGLDIGDNSTPALFNFSGDGKLELFSGSRHGNIFYYENNGSTQLPEWSLNTNKFLDQNFGGYSSICFVDIDNDSDTDLMFGNVKGGLYFYRNLSVSNVRNLETNPIRYSIIESFPNPFNPEVNIVIKLENSGTVSLKVFNLLGKEVKNIYSGYLDSGKYHFRWNGTNDSYVSLSAGHYFILLRTEEKHITHKITYLK